MTEAYKSPPGLHRHRCAHCPHVWEHGGGCHGNTRAHTCPCCGRVLPSPWKWYKGDEPPEEVCMDNLTAWQKILLATNSLEKRGRKHFTSSELVVQAWKLFPDTFHLAEFTQYPDSNKVLSSLMGQKGLVKQGLLAREDARVYSVTPAGRRERDRLEGKEVAAEANLPTLKLSRAHCDFLVRLLGSEANQKLAEGRKTEVTATDAWTFWDFVAIKPKGAAVVNERLEAIGKTLQYLELHLTESDALLPGGRVITGQEVRHLMRVHEWLQERFEVQLNIMRAGR